MELKMICKSKIINRFFLFSLFIMPIVIGVNAVAQEKGKGISVAEAEGIVFKSKGWQPKEYQILNINNIWTWARRNGRSGHSPAGDYGTFFPRGKTYILYQDGFVFGSKAYVDAEHTQPAPYGQLVRVGGATYGTGYTAGWVNGQGATATREPLDSPLNRMFRVRRDWKEMPYAEAARDAAESNEITLESVNDAHVQLILDQYAESWNLWPVQNGAPFIDRNDNGVYDPPPADFKVKDLIEMGYDEPGISGSDPNSPADQVLFTIYNDLHRATSLDRFRSEPTGLEVQETVWGYNRSGPMGNVFFRKWRFINKGGVEIDASGTLGAFHLDSMYVVQWADMVLGDYTDDCLGSDTTLNMGYEWNGNAIDRDFRKWGLPPAAAGFDYLQGPIVPSAGDTAVFDLKYKAGYKNLGMTGFSYFSAASAYSDPGGSYDTNTLRWYKMMRGYAPIGAPGEDIRYNFPPGYTPDQFPLAGDPVTGIGHIDCQGTDYSIQPGDRRLVMISGPFSLAPGDTNEAVIAFVAGLGADRYSSISVMKFNDRFAQNTYDALFQVPSAPPSPKVVAAELDGKILLEWGSDIENVTTIETKVSEPGSFAFEGYNLYQLPSATATVSEAKRIVTYDKVTDPAVVLDEQFDVLSGQILMTPVQFGTNSGIKRQFVFDRDYLLDVNKLNNGTDYYIAVTAYSVATVPGYLPSFLESPIQIVKVVPQIPFGTVYEQSYGDTIVAAHAAGVSDGNVFPVVIDPVQLTGHSYEVAFTDVDGDGVTEYNLKDLTNGSLVIEGGTNQAGDDNYLFTDGFQLRVLGAPLNFKAFEVTAHAGGVQDPPLQGATDWGGFPVEYTGRVNQQNGSGWFFAGGGASSSSYSNFLSRTITSGWSNLIPNDFEYRFTGKGTGNYAWDVWGVGALVDVPFEIWDVTRDVRLIPWFYDYDGDGDWGLMAVDHPGSGGANDPYTDWIYPYLPKDNTPGQGSAGYDAWLAAAQADPNYATSDGTDVGARVMGRNVFFQWNGGDVSDGTLDAVAIKEIEVGSVWRLTTNKPNTVNDIFTFLAPLPTTGAELDKLSVKKVGVFPNPYLAFNPLETNKLGRFVTFNNLPPQVKISIFAVSGHLVRVLEKDGSDQFMRWDLLNRSGMPIASGIYLAYVDMPGIGETKILKVAIVLEAEILDNF